MGLAAALPGNKKGEIKDADAVWRVREIVAGRNQPTLIGDRLYVVDDGAVFSFSTWQPGN